MFDIDEFHVMPSRLDVHDASYGHVVERWLALVDDLMIPRIDDLLPHHGDGHVLIVVRYVNDVHWRVV